MAKLKAEAEVEAMAAARAVVVRGCRRPSERSAYFFPKSPAAVILSPSLTTENPASVNSQSVMVAR